MKMLQIARPSKGKRNQNHHGNEYDSAKVFGFKFFFHLNRNRKRKSMMFVRGKQSSIERIAIKSQRKHRCSNMSHSFIRSVHVLAALL